MGMSIKISKMSEAEKNIMRIIWEVDTPITSNDVMTAFEKEKQWKITTILTFLTRLVEKGIISYEKKGKTNFYSANITAEQYSQFEAREYLDASYNGSIKSFMAALYHSENISKDDVEQLRQWLNEQEVK
jgi:predicted transcriptional regulator